MNGEWSLKELYSGYDDPRFNGDMAKLDGLCARFAALAEKQLYERFDRMIGKKSAVYISHRLASTRFCDRIAMFMDGRLADYGTHDELISRGGEYARLFEVQAQYYLDHPEGEEDAE